MARNSGQRRRRIPLGLRLRAWGESHRNAARETLRQLLVKPLATVMTVGAIAIALALPAALHLLLANLEGLGGDWRRSAAISLFLKAEVDETQAGALATRLRGRMDLVGVELISREQGLAEFRDYSGLGGALDALEDNPLPVVLALYPAANLRDDADLAGLLAALEALPETDFARIDTQWAERLNAILRLLHQGVVLLALALSLAVLLVIGNSIRLEIENRRDEILIMDLVGATTAFVRRPFLYTGAWYGLLGGLVAWALVTAGVLALQGPVGHLAALYHTDFRLIALAPLTAVALIGVSVLLGILGSWIAVGRHLRQIDPA